MPKLGIVVSHPIQYYAPLFRYLARNVDLEVFYGYHPTPEQVGNSGFGIPVDWGIDLLDGYPYRFLTNQAAPPSTERFRGVDTPGIGAEMTTSGVTHCLILGWNLKSYWQAFTYCLTHGIPAAARGDSQINPAERQLKSLGRRLLYPLFLRRYARILYVGKRNRDYLLRNGARAEQLLFSPHAVDHEFWRPQPRIHSTSRAIRFLWVAKFIAKKRPEDAIRGFLRALRERADLELWMVGTGECEQDCRSLATGEARVRFLGFRTQPELCEIYQATDCLLLTSDARETWGLVTNEAMAMGIPAVVSDACGCSEDLIQDGKTGFRYRVFDTDALASRILQVTDTLTQDPEHFATDISRINQTYSFSQSLNAIETLLRESSPARK